MEVIFIGSGVGVPSLRRGSPGLVVKVGEEKLLFDSGPGTLRKMLEAGFTYHDIDRIFYTHFHLDHIADLAPFLFAAKYASAPRERDIIITGPQGFKEYYEQLVQLHGSQIVSRSYSLSIHEIGEGEIVGQNWKIVTRSLPHTEESIGYRIEDSEGNVVVYAGDSGYSEGLVDLGRDADLLILECSFPEEVTGHLSPTLAGKAAEEANARRLVLVHLYPVCDQVDILTPCQREFRGEVVVAEDLMRFEV